MLFHLLRLLATLLLPRGCIWQSGKRRFLLVVPVAVTLAVFPVRFSVVLLHIREIDPLFRTLPTQIRETGELRDVATTAAVYTTLVFCVGM